MFRKFHQKLKEHEEGFTLIELLVVILIIAILAAIAIPVFLRQREKGYIADVQSTLKNTATAAESWGTSRPTPGDFTGISWAVLQTAEDVKAATTQGTPTVQVNGTDTNTYCIIVTDTRLGAATGDHEWQTASYSSSPDHDPTGRPSPEDSCDAGTA